MIIKRIVAATFIVLSGTAIDAQAENAFRVTLLGTGTPLILPDRLGPATLVEAGNLKLLFDAGRGVPLRLAQVGISPAKIDVLFITHYHSDHVHGIPDLWLTGWLQAGGQRTEAFHVIGPTGAKNLMTNLERAFSSDISMRIADQDLPPAGVTPRVDEFAADGIVYERDGVRVTAEVKTSGPTGVEMEALTAVSVACLTLYDMLKAVDRAMCIGGIRVLEKAGGRSGHYRAEANARKGE